MEPQTAEIENKHIEDCSICGGHCVDIGTLGCMHWTRCTQCGTAHGELV